MNVLSLREEKAKWEKIQQHLKTAIGALREVQDNGGVDLTLLIERHTEASDESRLLFEKLRVAQKECSHTWVDDGRDSHYDWRKCTKCGVTDRC